MLQQRSSKEKRKQRDNLARKINLMDQLDSIFSTKNSAKNIVTDVEEDWNYLLIFELQLMLRYFEAMLDWGSDLEQIKSTAFNRNFDSFQKIWRNLLQKGKRL